jgi:hypothetical protein
MITEAHNKLRAEKWTSQFNKEESKIFLIVGKKEDGTYTFATDMGKNPFKVSQELSAISKALHKKYK